MGKPKDNNRVGLFPNFIKITFNIKKASFGFLKKGICNGNKNQFILNIVENVKLANSSRIAT